MPWRRRGYASRAGKAIRTCNASLDGVEKAAWRFSGKGVTVASATVKPSRGAGRYHAQGPGVMIFASALPGIVGGFNLPWTLTAAAGIWAPHSSAACWAG